MRQMRLSLLCWFVVALLVLTAPFFIRGTSFSLHAPAQLSELGDAPRIVMTDSTGAQFDSASLAGKVWVVNFFFASCEGVCPAVNGRIAALYREFESNPAVQFVSITIDPETDTPERLAEYAKRFGADSARWHFLTAPAEKIRETLEAGFRLISPEDKNMHTTRVVLIDTTGKIRNYYQGTQDDFITQAKVDIAGLARITP